MRLRPILPSDEKTILRILTDPIVAKTYMLPDYPDPKDAIPLFQRLVCLSADPTRYTRGICTGGQLIGIVNDTEILDGSIELGYAIDSSCHQRGHMTRALTLAISELFSLGYHTVLAGAFEENTASIRVMEKCGMHRIEKTDLITYRGNTHQCVYYAIKKQEP